MKQSYLKVILCLSVLVMIALLVVLALGYRHIYFAWSDQRITWWEAILIFFGTSSFLFSLLGFNIQIINQVGPRISRVPSWRKEKILNDS